MNDYLSFACGNKTEYCHGTYYNRRPKSPLDSGIGFNYEIVNESDKSYATVLNNIQTETELITIKTHDKINCRINGYCSLQDGGFYQISGIITVPAPQDKRHALRILKQSVEKQSIIRLIAVQNPWGI